MKKTFLLLLICLTFFCCTQPGNNDIGDNDINASRLCIFVSADNGDDLNDGLSFSSPKETIQAGIAAAEAYDRKEILVSTGIYDVSQSIEIPGGLAIRGGYSYSSNSFWARNPYKTDDDRQASPSVINVDEDEAVRFDHAANSSIEGFVINGGGDSDDRSFGIYNDYATEITIEYNTISGGSSSDDSYGIYNYYSSVIIRNNTVDGGGLTGSFSYGIYNYSSSPLIEGNDLNGGIGPKYSYGIYNYSQSEPEILDNIINGGSGESWSKGIENFVSNPTIRGNAIDGGYAGDHSIGIDNSSSDPVIEDNTISGGNASLVSEAVSNSQSSPLIRNNTLNGGSSKTQSTGIKNITFSDPLVCNNVIDGGDIALFSYGIHSSSSSPVIHNNRINGGRGSINSYGISDYENSASVIMNNTIASGSGDEANGIRIDESGPEIMNNIIFASAAANGYGIYEENESSDPAKLMNNDIFGCSTALYFDSEIGSVTSFSNIGDINSLTDIDECGGNISADAQFCDQAGGDWHLTAASPPAVAQGGLDLSAEFTFDFDGRTRTVPWSMGAYEY